MHINILLPYKEKFGKSNPSSVSITIINNLNKSELKDRITIYGRNVDDPFPDCNFFGINKSINIFKSKNKHLASVMCKEINKLDKKNQIIELHNRPYLVDYIKKKLKEFPICIHFHNDPQEMKGSKTVKQRQKILDDVYHVYCVSNYIREKFIIGLKGDCNKVHVLYNGVDRKINLFPKKEKEIIFVGRLVFEKGAHLYVNAVSLIANKYPDWKFIIIGSSHLGSNKKNPSYAQNVSKKFKNIGKNCDFTGYISPEEVQKRMQSSSIIVIPSLWEEPFGLVVSEAMANGIAIIASKVGAIPEILSKDHFLIEKINEKKIEKHILKLICDSQLLKKHQKLSWKKFKLSSAKSSNMLDNLRKNIVRSINKN
jgi:glycosyltransferase involved in cell wall biosynthesis